MDGFSDWARRHCTVFGLLDPRHIEMVSSWQSLFDAAGYSAGELNAATDWLATHSPPEFPSQHLRAVQHRIRSRRAIDLTDRRGGDDVPLCVLCGGGGLVMVPDTRGVRQGRWVGFDIGAGACFYTHSARCTCYRGRTINCTDREGNLLIDLATHEAVNPGWQEQLASHDRELAETARLGDHETAKAVDEALAAAMGESDGPVF